IVVSIPLLAAVVLIYYNFLSSIINSNIILELHQRFALTFVLLAPAGLLMGFQFPSITRMASSYSSLHLSEGHTGNQDITLLWGINVIASVIGTVLTTTSSMVVGFNGNLLIGFGLYLGALASAIAAVKITQQQTDSQMVVK